MKLAKEDGHTLRANRNSQVPNWLNFLEDGEDAFRQACNAAGLFECDILVACDVIRLRFSGQAFMQRLLPALEHLLITPSQEPAQLTIHIWDRASSGIELKPPTWSQSEAEVLAGFRKAGLQTLYAFHNVDSGVFSMLDISRRLAFFYMDDASQLPTYEQGTPMLYIFHWWLAAQGKRLVHAGAVGTENGGVLLAGRGGSGKSTTAVACVTQGFLYLGDDYCIITLQPQPMVYSLYNTAKLTRQSCQSLADWLPAIPLSGWDHQEKQHYFLNQIAHERIAHSLPVRALLLPCIAGNDLPHLTAIRPSVALRELAASTIFQLRGAGESGLRLMGQLVQQVPCYILHLAGNLSTTPEILLQLLESHG